MGTYLSGWKYLKEGVEWLHIYLIPNQNWEGIFSLSFVCFVSSTVIIFQSYQTKPFCKTIPTPHYFIYPFY